MSPASMPWFSTCINFCVIKRRKRLFVSSIDKSGSSGTVSYDPRSANQFTWKKPCERHASPMAETTAARSEHVRSTTGMLPPDTTSARRGRCDSGRTYRFGTVSCTADERSISAIPALPALRVRGLIAIEPDDRAVSEGAFAPGVSRGDAGLLVTALSSAHMGGPRRHSLLHQLSKNLLDSPLSSAPSQALPCLAGVARSQCVDRGHRSEPSDRASSATRLDPSTTPHHVKVGHLVVVVVLL
jgi:hypothetical protein